MHELVSYSHVPALREEQVLNILAGVTGTQPVDIAEQHLVFAQVKVPDVAVNKKTQIKQQTQPQQTKRLVYDQLVRPLSLPLPTTTTTSDSLPTTPWSFLSEQTPSASTTATRPGQVAAPYISREVSSHPASPQDITRLTSLEWYKYRYQYILLGHRFIHGNIVVRVYRYFYASKATSLEKPIESPVWTMEDLSPVDLSGAWVVDATVRVEEGVSAEVMERGKRELERFRGAMDGAMEFRAVDRLALDTRVRGV